MAGGKEIRTKIKSIQNTQKITRAMEMVAASKMRNAQKQMQESRPYAEKIRNVISHLAAGHPEYRHAYLEAREPKRVGYIIVSTDRGLCGGLNINLFRSVTKELKYWQDRDVGIDLCLIGKKAESFFRRAGGNVLASVNQLGETPELGQLIGVVKTMLDAYLEGATDRLYVIHNEFKSTMSQVPFVSQLLPVVQDEAKDDAQHWDYLYEPDAKELLDELLGRFIESQVYNGVVDNIACEQAARMIAMKSASDNASDLIDELQLVYNKARQSAITQELSEIVAGAAAV